MGTQPQQCDDQTVTDPTRPLLASSSLCSRRKNLIVVCGSSNLSRHRRFAVCRSPIFLHCSSSFIVIRVTLFIFKFIHFCSLVTTPGLPSLTRPPGCSANALDRSSIASLWAVAPHISPHYTFYIHITQVAAPGHADSAALEQSHRVSRQRIPVSPVLRAYLEQIEIIHFLSSPCAVCQSATTGILTTPVHPPGEWNRQLGVESRLTPRRVQHRYFEC